MPDQPEIVVVDDEKPLRDAVGEYLSRHGFAVRCVEGGEALRAALRERPADLVLLDIAMPGMDGIDVARALSRSDVDPAVVFVTAFDNFAVAAFDVAAIDYLMKPVESDRLERALERVRAWLEGGKRGSAKPESTHVEEFWVPDHTGLVRIAASDIQRITAERDYMRLHVGARSWLIHRTIAKLEEDLDPALFIRVHRSVILRRDTIIGLYRDEAGHWTARLADGAEQRIGRSYVDEVKRFAGR
jgi:two-component system response regulator AlgR